MAINKLMGFYELRDSSLPAVDWKQYKGNAELSDEYLWTVRTAKYSGSDINLPRYVGVTAEEACKRLAELYGFYKDDGMAVFYPYFIADKSGSLSVYNDRVAIEAVNADLWNLATRADVSIIKPNDGDEERRGNSDFLTPIEVEELYSYVPTVKKMFRNEFTAFSKDSCILLEWSFAYRSDINKQRVGNRYFVFYEARTVVF